MTENESLVHFRVIRFIYEAGEHKKHNQLKSSQCFLFLSFSFNFVICFRDQRDGSEFAGRV